MDELRQRNSKVASCQRPSEHGYYGVPLGLAGRSLNPCFRTPKRNGGARRTRSVKTIDGGQHEKGNTFIKTFLVAAILVFCLTATSYAQVEHRLTLNAGAGFTPLVVRIGNSLNSDWA